jgi:hypothetical protein
VQAQTWTRFFSSLYNDAQLSRVFDNNKLGQGRDAEVGAQASFAMRLEHGSAQLMHHGAAYSISTAGLAVATCRRVHSS